MDRHVRSAPVWKVPCNSGILSGLTPFSSSFGGACCTGVTRRGRSVVALLWTPEYFREDRLQGIRPDLIPSECRMKLVGIHHAGKQPAILVRELVVNIEVPDFSAISHPRNVAIDLVDCWNDSHAVIARKNRRHDDGCVRGFGLANVQERSLPLRDALNLFCITGLGAHIVNAREHN